MTAGDRGQAIARQTIPANRQRPPLDYHQAATPIPVIARIIWHDREEWWPARADAWTDQLVHVTWTDTGWRQEWLEVGDVRRCVVVEREGDG